MTGDRRGLARPVWIVRKTRAGVAALWSALPPVQRLALAGALAFAVVALALGVLLTSEIRTQVLLAEARGLHSAVTAIEDDLEPLIAGGLTLDEIEVADRLVDRALLDADHVRAKLWAPDGTVLYSDVHELIGRRFERTSAAFRAALAGRTESGLTDLSDPENEFEQGHERLIEYYVPFRDRNGTVVAVFEIYEETRLLEEALGRITVVTWLAIGSALGLLLVFVVLLVAGTVRSIAHDRAAAEARAEELAILVGAADALASSLEPAELLARLEAKVRRRLGLTRLEVQREPSSESSFGHRLRDGTWLVAERDSPPLTDEDTRILDAVASNLDAALANAALYAEVRSTAQIRRELLHKVVEAHEDERRILVGELHDTIAPVLIRILYGIRGIIGRSDGMSARVKAELADLDGLIADLERDLRRFMGHIRPAALDEFGIKGAMEVAVGRYRQEAGMDVALRMSGPLDTCPADVQLVLFRAAEEGLLNARKHARAGRVAVGLSARDGRVRLTVDDDGVGPDRAAAPDEGRGLGLEYLRERVAVLGGSVGLAHSRLGGTRLTVEIPRAG